MSGSASDVKLEGLAYGALLGAATAALGVAAFDTTTIIAAKGGVWACSGAGAAALVLAAAGAVAALSVVWIMRAALGRLQRVGVEWSSVLSAMLGAGMCVLGAQAWVLKVLTGHGIRTAVVALSGAVGVAAAVTLCAAVRGMLRGAELSVRARASVVVGSLSALGVAVVALAPGFVDELDVPELTGMLLPLGGGLIGALAGVQARLLRRVAVGVALLLGLQAAAFTLMPRPPRAWRFMRETSVTLTVLRMFEKPPRPVKLSYAGTCHPGVPLGPISGHAKAPDDAPDILLITSDAVRWDHTSMSGYARDTTPKLAKWSRSAAVFSQAHTPASSTRQTFRALFTGLLPSQVPASASDTWWGVSFAPGQRTLASYLRDAGYLTISANARGEGFNAKTGALQGFDRQRRRKPVHGGEGQRRAARAVQQLDQLLTELRAPRTGPRFLWTHLGATHQPYSVDRPSPYGTTEIDRYDGAIRFVDRELDRVLHALKKEQRLENTVVVFSADHGQAFHEHGNSTHGHTVYQEETHVPLLIWGPGVSPGVREAPVSTLDLFPTLLDLAGLGAVKAVCGDSLLPTLRDASHDPNRDVYIEQVPDSAPHFAYALIRGRYKLVISPRYRTQELFDIRTDPKDANDLSEQRPAELAKLLKALAALQKRRGLDPRTYALD